MTLTDRDERERAREGRKKGSREKEEVECVCASPLTLGAPSYTPAIYRRCSPFKDIKERP